MNSNKNLLIFKTDIYYLTDIMIIGPLLNRDDRILKWSIDLHDIDKVLRLETENMTTENIELLLQQAGYTCLELPD